MTADPHRRDHRCRPAAARRRQHHGRARARHRQDARSDRHCAKLHPRRTARALLHHRRSRQPALTHQRASAVAAGDIGRLASFFFARWSPQRGDKAVALVIHSKARAGRAARSWLAASARCSPPQKRCATSATRHKAVPPLQEGCASSGHSLRILPRPVPGFALQSTRRGRISHPAERRRPWTS